MDDVSSVEFGAGVRAHQSSIDRDVIEREAQAAEAEGFTESPKSADSALGKSEPSDGPRAHVQRLGREYGIMVSNRLTASVSNAVDMCVNSLGVAKPRSLLIVL